MAAAGDLATRHELADSSSCRATRCCAHASERGIQPRNLRAHPRALSKAVGSDQPGLEHSGTTGHFSHALPDRFRPFEATWGATQQRFRQSGPPGLRTAVAWRVVGGFAMKTVPAFFEIGVLERLLNH